MVNTDALLDVDFAKLYPISMQSFEVIKKRYGVSDRVDVTSEIIVFSSGSSNIIIVNRLKPIKSPTIEKIMEILIRNNIFSGDIIVSGYSKRCVTSVSKFRTSKNTDFSLVPISKLMTERAKSTITVGMGSMANKLNSAVEKKKNVTLRVPVNGYPEVGLEGNLSSKDLYKLIDEAILYKRGFDLVMKSFEDLSKILSNGESIDSNDWNSVMNQRNVYKFLEEDLSE